MESAMRNGGLTFERIDDDNHRSSTRVNRPISDLRFPQPYPRKIWVNDVILGAIALASIGAVYVAAHGIAAAMVVYWLRQLLLVQ